MRRTLFTLAGLAACVACADGPAAPLGTESLMDAALLHAVETESVAADGSFALLSTVRNAGSAPVTVGLRSCFFQPGDLRGETAGLRIHEPLVSCAAVRQTVTLAPGESAEALRLTGVAEPGEHTLELRHVLDPELWSTLVLRVP